MLLHVDSTLGLAAPVTTMAGLALGAWLYTRGWRRYRSTLSARFATSQLACFLGGLACLWLAIVSPLDEAAETLLSAHMVQHMLLLTVAPALLLLGEPLLPLLRGLPDSLRPAVAAPLGWRSLRGALHSLSHPIVALVISSAVFWGWHSPALYQLALAVPTIHLVEHASFFGAGLLFWYPVVQPWPSRPRWPRGAIIPYLLIADVQNTVLAAVFTFSDRVLYPFYALPNGPAAAAALDDQVLAGVIMWVPMSLAYLVPAVWLTMRLLSPTSDRREAGVAQFSWLEGEISAWKRRFADSPHQEHD